jgi:hypothetical protein
MNNQNEFAIAAPAGHVKHRLLRDAAQARQQLGRNYEEEPKLPETPTLAMPAGWSFTPPTWSALHE